MNRLTILCLTLALVPAAGCMTHAVRVEPITLAPVQVTMDVNLHVDERLAEATPDAGALPDASSASSPER